MKIGEFARTLRLPVTTVRYYERVGLLQPSHRSDGGFRLYSPECVSVGRFVCDARRRGLALGDVRALLAFRTLDGADDRRRLERMLRRRLERIDQRLAELRESREVLQRALAVCRARGAPRGVVVLERLVRPGASR